MEQDKEDAKLLAKQLAEMQQPKQDEPKSETVEIQATAEENVSGHDFSPAVKTPSDPRALAPEEAIVDLMAGRRLGSEPSRKQRKPKKLRTFSNFDEYEEEAKKKPKPVTNIYDRLAQRREDYKEREKIM